MRWCTIRKSLRLTWAIPIGSQIDSGQQIDMEKRMSPVLQMESLESGYGEVQVLWGISFQVERGKDTAMVGANGAGKTTTLRTIMGSVRPWHGRILLTERI